MNMKHLLLIPALLLSIAACKKYEAGYIVNCQFGVVFGENRVLVVTNPNGEVIKTFDVPEGSNFLSEQFTVEGKDLPERYDLHLVYDWGYDNLNRSKRVHSHLDVENGALVHFAALPEFLSSIKPAFIEIRDLESFDSLDVVGAFTFNGNSQVNFSPGEKKLTFLPYVLANQGLFVRLKANGEAQFRHLYLPDSLVSDTISVAWQDFTPEINWKEIGLPADYSPFGDMEINAVSSDFKHSVTLVQTRGYVPLPSQFLHPTGLQEPVAYRIRLELIGASYEKIFQPGEPLLFKPTDMAIDNIEVSGAQLAIRTSGQIDMLRAEITSFEPGNFSDNAVYWQIDGKPESFEAYSLPVFSDYLPDWFTPTEAIQHLQIMAMRYDKHDYPQIREGFPERLNEPFAVARSGYSAVWKHK